LLEIKTIESDGVLGEDVVKRFLGRRIRGENGITRVDALKLVTRKHGSSITYEHSLVRGPNERFFAMGIESAPLQILEDKNFEPIQGELVFIDPFQFALYGNQVIGRRKAFLTIQDYVSGFNALPTVLGDEPTRLTMIGKSNRIAIRFDFHLEHSWMILKATTSVSSLDPKSKRIELYVDASELKDWVRVHSTSAQWTQIERVGWLPYTVSANTENYMPKYPKAMQQIECRFFDYEFDKDKIDKKLLAPESFIADSIKKDFNVQDLERRLKKESSLGRSKPSPK